MTISLAGTKSESRVSVGAGVGSVQPLLVLAAAFVARLIPAASYFFNPDEALHYLAASQPSIKLTYQAALTNAHPPLLILLLHFWQWLGHSELILRMPSVLAGTACCWLFFLWLTDITNRTTAFTGLLFIAFAPALIALSSEVRQYSLLLFFIAACLLLSERALRSNSAGMMALFSLSLAGALLTHYSSLLFALVIGIYVFVRVVRHKTARNVVVVWILGQIIDAGIVAYFLLTHVRRLKAMGMPQEIAETWLRRSIFHSAERNIIAFISVQTLRVFTYLFSHGLVGSLVLLSFLFGLFALLRPRSREFSPPPTRMELALLLSLPFVLNCAAAIAGIYPFGGTRHNALLAPFAIAGAAIGISSLLLDRSWPKAFWIKVSPVMAALVLCNLFPSPPPLIKAKNHSERLMRDAIDYLRVTTPSGSVIFSDYESGLLLGFYACDHGIVQIFPPLKRFAKADCSVHTVITARPDEWRFKADNFQSELNDASASYNLMPGTKVWLFNAGWINDLAPAISRGKDCSQPRLFGENILICELTVGPSKQAPRRAATNVSPVFWGAGTGR